MAEKSTSGTHSAPAGPAPRTHPFDAKGRTRRASPYQLANDWLDAKPGVRARKGAKQVADYKRIANVPQFIGERLDALGASYEQMRWVAGASGADCAVELERRYRALATLLEQGPSNGQSQHQAFVALMASMPKVGKGAIRARVAAEKRRAADGRRRKGKR